MRDDHTVIRERRSHVDTAFREAERSYEARCRIIGLDLEVLAADNAAALLQDFFE